METTIILSFLGASVLLTLLPGPDNIFVLTESLTKGSRNGIAISIGLVSGILIHTLAAATGLSLIIKSSAIAFSIIKYIGAGYLFFLALKAIKEGKPIIQSKKGLDGSRKSFLLLVRKGFIMNVLNPKVSLFFIAFLPQFTRSNGIDMTIQMIILGLIFMLQALVIFSLVASLSGRLSTYLNSPKFWKITKWSKVSVMSLLGLTLLFSKK